MLKNGLNLAVLGLILIPGVLVAQNQPQAQQGPPSAVPEETLPFPAIDCGLNVRVSGHRIADGCLQSALNVKYNLDGTIQSRDGYGQCNATLLPTGAGVRRMYEFDASDGTKYLVAQSSSSFYNANTDCNFSVIPGLQNLSLTLNTSCTQALGKLWCVNQTDGLFWWDGTSTGFVVGAPNGTLIDNYANRILIGNVAGSQSQLYVSGYLDGTNWITSNRSTSPAILPLSGINDGKEITCLMGAYQSTFILAQERRLFGFYGTDNSNFVMRELSNEVGCIEPQSVQQYDNKLVWMSQRGIEQMNGPTIDWRGSDPVYPILSGIVAAKGNSRNATDTSQSNFQAGNLTASGPGAAMSATISPGSVVPSTWGFVDSTFTTGWGGTLANTTTTANGYIGLNSSLISTVMSSSSSWVFGVGTNRFSGSANTYSYNYPSGTGYQYISTNSLTSGAWSVTMMAKQFSGTPINYNYSQVDFVFMSDGSNYSSANGYSLYLDGNNSVSRVATLSLRKLTNGTPSVLVSTTLAKTSQPSYDNEFLYSFLVSRDTSNSVFVVYWGANSMTATDSTFKTTNSYMIENVVSHAGGDNYSQPAAYISNVSPSIYPASGTYVSVVFDSGISTPTWGPFSAIESTFTGAGITFQVQSSSNGVDTFQALTSQTANDVIVAGQKQYLRYRANFSTTMSTRTAYLAGVGLTAETTGYFISQCRQPTEAITSWGLFQCNKQDNGGSLSFWVSTGATCAGATSPGANWQAQTNNSAILAATSTAIAYRTLFSMTSASNTPTLQDCTINWNEGTSRPQTASGVYNHVYHLFFTTGTSGSVGNDHVLTLDQFGRWSLWDDVPGASAVFYNRQLIIGNANATGLAYILYTGNSDNGNPFTSEFRTRDFDLGNWRARKEFGPLYLEIDPAPDQKSSVPLTVTGFVDLNTTANLGPGNTGEDTGLVVSRFPWPVEFQSQGRYISIDVSNRGTQPWKLYRGALRYRVIREE